MKPAALHAPSRDAGDAPVLGRIRVRGQVQGVGFRPFVWRVATELGLAGWVRNDGHGVTIEAEGRRDGIQALVARLEREPPPLARVDAVDCRLQAVPGGAACAPFTIAPSRAGAVRTTAAPDAAVCAECLRELFDPADRRHRYPFVNCTHCGPRYTIIESLPYDRPSTTMAGFTMCEACDAEYRDPASRRFHAQPNACPACGPRLELRDADGRRRGCADAIARAASRIAGGAILAIKGIGGYHLVCDAGNARAVSRLRDAKRRDGKPFAVMAANAASALAWAECGEHERALLESDARPIVLLRKRAGCDARFPGVAPELAWIGVMLPYAPLHHLLFHELLGRPPGTGWMHAPQEPALVVTSANPCAEPLVCDDAEALERLHGIAEGFLLHDRAIRTRCDDSVVRATPAGGSLVRRARGHAPRPIALAHGGPPVLACGAHDKSTVCLTRGDEAFVSQHVGDLDNAAVRDAWQAAVAHLERLLGVRPRLVVHDLHPDYASTRLGADFARALGIATLGVQHHHAHCAAVMAEHRVQGPAIGLALDGHGLGADGGAWGGELLHVGDAGAARIGHLATLALPGGDRAAREPWRMAAAALHALGRDDAVAAYCPPDAAPVIERMLAAGTNCPPSSSAGRLFDAAAGLLRVKPRMDYEGQAAMILESLAERHGDVAPLPGGFEIRADGTLSLLPLLDAIAGAGAGHAARAAALFHATLVAGLARWAVTAAREHGCRDIVLAGGCFLNRILAGGLRRALEAAGLRVHEACRVPPNDGGISLGQAWLGLRALAAGGES